jgi:hypothetical protein
MLRHRPRERLARRRSRCHGLAVAHEREELIVAHQRKDLGDCLEHGNIHNGVVIKDFEIGANYQIPLIRTRGPIGAVRWT